MSPKNRHAVALGKLGGKAGGKKGGNARAKKLSKKRRVEIARIAATLRWARVRTEARIKAESVTMLAAVKALGAL